MYSVGMDKHVGAQPRFHHVSLHSLLGSINMA